MKRQFCIGIATYILCLFQLGNIGIANAQTQCANVNITNGCLKINNNSLQILLQDIVPSQETVQQVSNGNIQGSSLPTLAGTPPTVNTQISRTINNLWEIEVSEGSQNDVVVQYSYGTFYGQSNSVIQILSVIPTEPIVTPSSTPGKVIVQGGAIFNFNFSNTKASGNYSGNLNIKITVPSAPN
jgi:hypothetical protein